MRSGHNGLIELAKSKGINLRTMEKESAVLFISRDRMRMKSFTWNGVLCYLRAQDIRRPFDIDDVNDFVTAFNPNGTMDYQKALRVRLEKIFKERGRPKRLEVL